MWTSKNEMGFGEGGRVRLGNRGGGGVGVVTIACVHTEDTSLRLEPGVMTSSVPPKALQFSKGEQPFLKQAPRTAGHFFEATQLSLFFLYKLHSLQYN